MWLDDGLEEEVNVELEAGAKLSFDTSACLLIDTSATAIFHFPNRRVFSIFPWDDYHSSIIVSLLLSYYTYLSLSIHASDWSSQTYFEAESE